MMRAAGKFINLLVEHVDVITKPIARKLGIAMATLIMKTTCNTSLLANFLPLPIKRRSREQWMRRLLDSKKFTMTILDVFLRRIFNSIHATRQTIVIAMDQTELGNRMATLSCAVRYRGRALACAWRSLSGPANLGFEYQKELLDRIHALLPEGADVIILADRFYGSDELLAYIRARGWKYRIRLKGVYNVWSPDLPKGCGKTGDIPVDWKGEVLLFDTLLKTTVAVIHENPKVNVEPWIIACDSIGRLAQVLDYGLRWCIESMFKDWKSGGFGFAATRVGNPARLDRLLLILVLAMLFCIHASVDGDADRPGKTRSLLSDFQYGLRLLGRAIAYGDSRSMGFVICV